MALRVAAEGLSMTVTDVGADAARGRRVSYGPLTGDLVVTPGSGDVPVVSVDGKPVAPSADTGSGGGEQKPPDEVIVTPPPGPGDPPASPLTASGRGGKVRLSKAGVALIAAQVRGGVASGTVTLTAKLGRRTVRIGSARVVLPEGHTV